MDFKYDVSFSFAGEDRGYVEKVAGYLLSKNIKVFYDKFEQTDLWGKDLGVHFDTVYRKCARYCVIFLSAHYKQKIWTKYELRLSIARAIESESEYILPARFDDTEIEGIRPTIAFIDLRLSTPSEFADMIIEKINQVSEMGEETAVDRAVRYTKEKEKKKFLADYLASEKGQEDFKNEAYKLLDHAEKTVWDIEKQSGVAYGCTKLKNRHYGCSDNDIGLHFVLKQPSWPWMKDASIVVLLLLDNKKGNDVFFDFERASTIKKQEYLFYLNPAGTVGWVRAEDKSGFKTTEQLMDFWQKEFLDTIKQREEDKEKPPRNPPISSKNPPSKNSY